MSPIRYRFKNDKFSSFININNSANDNRDLNRSRSNLINEQRSISKTQQTPSKINDMPTAGNEENPESDDCFVKFGFVSSSEEKNQRITKRNHKQKLSKTQIEENENEPDQPAHLVEEIAAITALIIYDSHSKKHEFTFSAQHRAKSATYPKHIRDNIDRFDALYSCLVNQSESSSKKTNLLSHYLRNRFFTLSDIEEFKTFQQNEQSRIYNEKKANLNRIPFIPNILSYQRTCPYYDLEEMKWIRDHLC